MSELLYLMSKGPEKFEENQQRMRNQKQAMMNRAAAAALPVKEEARPKEAKTRARSRDCGWWPFFNWCSFFFIVFFKLHAYFEKEA